MEKIFRPGLNDHRTEGPREAELRQLDLATITPGTMITIVTASGSKYWVVRVKPPVANMANEANTVRGASITTNSAMVSGIKVNPQLMVVDRYIEVGKRWKFGQGGSTNTVRSIQVG